MESLDDLRAAAEDGSLKDVPGFGKKAEENVAGRAGRRRRRREPAARAAVEGVAGRGQLLAVLNGHPALIRAELAGSARPQRRRRQGPRHRGRLERSGGPRRGVLQPPSRSTSFSRPARPGRGRSRTPGCGRPAHRPAAGLDPACSSTSPARGDTTRRCRPRPERGLHVSEYGITDDAMGRWPSSVTWRRCTSCWGWTGCRRAARSSGELEAARAGSFQSSRARRHSRRPCTCTPTASDGHGTIEEMARRPRARVRVPRRHRPLRDPRVREPREARRTAAP